MREWLANKRKEKKLSQKEVAQLCGITDAYYCYIENGERNPSVGVAKKIANELNLEWTLFFENKTNGTLVNDREKEE